MLTECARTCRTCQFLELIRESQLCADGHAECANWATGGECDKNPRFMLHTCSQSCGTCDAKRTGCARPATTPPAVTAPDGLSAVFRRAISDFPQYSPTVLSADPYILQFENVVTADEAAAMIGACPRLERSLAGDALSPVRTSTQCWCDRSNGCSKDATFAAVTERVLNITQLPYNNAEYWQVLKYEAGQFYKVHHDQQSGHWTPQGVRLYTFFIYLSDVEEGGGTRFTDAGLTVTPKLGRAVLWPSVYSADLTKSDLRTHHEALPVVKGVKYAANLWQHLYDFKSPSEKGLCVFLGQNSNHN